MRLRYSFVIDEHPRFILEGRIFLRAILAAGVRPADIVAQVTARSGEAGKQVAAEFGVRALELPLGPDGAYCNKINQLFTLADDQDFDVLVACDTDLAILRPLDEAATTEVIRAKRVDQENPPLAVLERIREFLEFPQQPALVAPGISPAASTYALNCNGGVLLIPRQFMRSLGEAWLGYARTLTDHRQLLEQWVNHIDQVSWAFAMLKLGLPFRELPVEYNFPTRLARRMPRGSFGQPVVLHYHRALDRKGRLRLSRVRAVDKCIKQVNRLLRSSGYSAAGSTYMMTGFYGRWVLPAAGVLLALATIAGAAGAHLLEGWSASRLEMYETAVRYQFYQSLGLLAMGVLLKGVRPDALTSAKRLSMQTFLSAPKLLFLGILLFCGGLYAISFGVSWRWIGLAPPIGGGAMIAAWLLFALHVWRFRGQG